MLPSDNPDAISSKRQSIFREQKHENFKHFCMHKNDTSTMYVHRLKIEFVNNGKSQSPYEKKQVFKA
jgi:hypothetical protein